MENHVDHYHIIGGLVSPPDSQYNSPVVPASSFSSPSMPPPSPSMPSFGNLSTQFVNPCELQDSTVLCEDDVGDGERVDQNVGRRGSVDSGQIPSSSQCGVEFEKPIADSSDAGEDVDRDAMIGVESQKTLSGSSEIEEEDTPMVDVESKGPSSETVQDGDVYRMIRKVSAVVESDESMVGVRPNTPADGNENHPESGVNLDRMLDEEGDGGHVDPTNTDESNQMSVDLDLSAQHALPFQARRSSRHAVANNIPSEKFTVSKSHRGKRRRTLRKDEILPLVSFSIASILKTN